MEIWKDIEGYEGYYQVSDMGRVKSLARSSIRRGRLYPQKESILKQNGKQYLMVALQRDGKSKLCSVHRLVAKAFIPNPENKAMVNHKFGIKYDNRASQLEWNTRSENEAHSVKNKLKHIPSNAKLSKSDVLNIREAILNGQKQKAIAEKYNIHTTTVSKIVNMASWRT